MKNNLLTCKTPIGYDDPALEFSAGISTPRATGGQPPALFGGFFVSVGMASYIPIMGWPCGEPKGSPIPVDRSANLYGLLTLLAQGGRENGVSFNRSAAMRCLNRLSAHRNSLSAEENLTTINQNHLQGIEEAYYALRALQSIYSDGGAAGDTQEAIISGYHNNLMRIIADKIQPAIDAM